MLLYVHKYIAVVWSIEVEVPTSWAVNSQTSSMISYCRLQYNFIHNSNCFIQRAPTCIVCTYRYIIFQSTCIITYDTLNVNVSYKAATTIPGILVNILCWYQFKIVLGLPNYQLTSYCNISDNLGHSVLAALMYCSTTVSRILRGTCPQFSTAWWNSLMSNLSPENANVVEMYICQLNTTSWQARSSAE